MKAALDFMMFLATVYDYCMTADPEPVAGQYEESKENDMDLNNTSNLSGQFVNPKQFNSMKEYPNRGILGEFDEEEEGQFDEENIESRNQYHSMDEDG